MQNRTDLKLIFEKAKDINFRNLFYPVIPSIDLTGKLAQIISALTQAVTIWFITQSKLSSLNIYLSYFLSIIAIVLVCAAIELGGRKGAQVVTRQAIWKKFENIWYYVLGIPILLVTIGLFYLSFDLSTKGVDKTFNQSVVTAITFDASDYDSRHDVLIDGINTKYDKQITTLTTAYTSNYSAMEGEYKSKVDAIDLLIAEHTRNTRKGVKWAQSHIDKQTRSKGAMVIEMQSALNQLTATHNTKISSIEESRAAEIAAENDRHTAEVNEAKTAAQANHDNDKQVAAFWGTLFSNLVGIMIVVALVCIVIVEIFRKGADIEITYNESELPPSTLGIAWQGIKNRGFNLSYDLVKKIYVNRREFDFDLTSKTVKISDQENYANIDLSLPLSQSKKNRDWNRLFGNGSDANDLYNFNEFSKNKKSAKHITETIDFDTTSSENEISATVEQKGRVHNVLDDLSLGEKNIQKTVISKTVVGQIVGEKNCLNCNEIFEYKNKKKKYCSDACRIAYWEQKNGKELKRGKAKKAAK